MLCAFSSLESSGKRMCRSSWAAYLLMSYCSRWSNGFDGYVYLQVARVLRICRLNRLSEWFIAFVLVMSNGSEVFINAKELHHFLSIFVICRQAGLVFVWYHGLVYFGTPSLRLSFCRTECVTFCLESGARVIVLTFDNNWLPIVHPDL